MSPRVLLVVGARPSGPEPQRGSQRRTDYRCVRAELGAELLDLHAVDRSGTARLVRRLAGSYAALAVLASRRLRRGDVDVVLLDNENTALVLALLLRLTGRDVPLVSLAIAPGASKKALFFLVPGLLRSVRRWLPHASVHADLLVGRLRVPVDRVQVLPFHADTAWFDPAAVPPDAPRPTPRPYVLAVGRQHRDHALLVAAAEGLDVDVVIDAGSAYSTSPDTLTGAPLPAQVHLVTLGPEALRAAYAGARAVVVPTVENDFGAGGTTMLEAMAMARPVVATRSEGGGDHLADRRAVLRGRVPRTTSGLFARQLVPHDVEAQGPHGFYVPVGDAAALRSALAHLVEDPGLGDELGRRGRALVDGGLSTDHFVARVCAAVRAVAAPAGGAGSSDR